MAREPVGEPDAAFAEAMRDIYVKAKKEAGYNATYFLRMLSEIGPMETARRLVTSTNPSEGFTALYLRGRLDLTVEAVMLKPQFSVLFTEEELECARQRLAEYGYQPPHTWRSQDESGPST